MRCLLKASIQYREVRIAAGKAKFLTKSSPRLGKFLRSEKVEKYFLSEMPGIMLLRLENVVGVIHDRA